MLATCEKGPTDAIKIKYDPRNPFDICSSTFSAIYKVSYRKPSGLAGTSFQILYS